MEEEERDKLLMADREELWDLFRNYTTEVVRSINEEEREEAVKKAGKLYALSTLMKFRGMI